MDSKKSRAVPSEGGALPSANSSERKSSLKTAPNGDLAADDLLIGAAAIADVFGVKPRRVFYLCENNLIPHFRIGTTLCARRSTLAAWIREQEVPNRGEPQ